MKRIFSFSPRRISWLVSLASLVISAVLFGVAMFTADWYRWVWFVVALAVQTVSLYVTLYNIITRYIISRLRPIYTTINSINASNDDLYKNINNQDIIDEVKNHVVRWAKDRTNEIQQLKASEKFRKEFLGNVSHELKTPIFNIQGYVLTLLDGGLKDRQINRKYLRRTAKNVTRLISIVEDLETISKLETGEMKPIPEKFDMIDLTKEVFEMLEKPAKDMGITLLVDNVGGTSKMVLADKKRITDALNNLVINSIKYGKPYGKTTVRITDTDTDIVAEVIDNGIGIDEQHLPRIFERFYRIDKSRSREMGGTGLGLAIVKHSLEAHNRKISVQSEVGVGTTFTFSLPKALPSISTSDMQMLVY